VLRIFISSVQRDYDDVRRVARAAVESLDLVPIIAETAGASPDSPRRALLDRVADADALLLLLGARYGERGESGVSPTEDEYREAERLGKPILVLRQNVNLDADQQRLLDSTRGGWEAGKLSGPFNDATDVGPAVVKALRELERRLAGVPDLEPAAQARAQELALGEGPRNTIGSGSKARVVAVPVLGRPLLDAVALDRRDLSDAIATEARASRLVTHAMGLDATVTGEGVRLVGKDPQAHETLNFIVTADGAVVAEGPVGGEGQFFAGMQVAAARLGGVIEGGVRFVQRVWQQIDGHDDVRQAAVMVAIPDAQSKVFTTEEPGNTMPGGAMGLPQVLAVPDPARIVRREDLADRSTVDALNAEVKRAFADAGAIHPR
jgi:hypothetical protein